MPESPRKSSAFFYAAFTPRAGMGFHREGIMRERWIVAGKKHDTIAYALLRDDWCAALRKA